MRKLGKLNVFNFFILFFFIAIVTVARFFQLNFFTDFNVGCNNFETYNLFNINFNLKSLSYIYYSIIFLYFLISILFYFKKNNSGDIISLYEQKNDIGLFSKVYLMVCFLVFFVESIFYVITINSIKLKGGLLTIAGTVISQILFSFYFLYLFYCFNFKKFKKDNPLNIIFVFPVFWGVMRLFGFMFLNHFLYFTPRENFISNFKVVFSCLFLFYFGKFLIGANSKKNEKNIIFFGFLSVFFNFISVLPRIIFYFYNFKNAKDLVSLPYYKKNPYFFNIDILNAVNFIIIDFFVAIFILTFLVKYLINWKNKKLN